MIEKTHNTECEKMLAGQLYRASDPEIVAMSQRTRRLLRDYNATLPGEPQRREHLLSQLLGKVGARAHIEPPFYCDFGAHIELGDDVYMNFNCVILDCAWIRLGDKVLLGPGVQLYGATHPLDPDIRADGLEYGLPITIEDNVWIGGGAIVNPGITVGRDSVIGSGSVVTRDIPPGVVAAGNPCRVMRDVK